MAAVPKLGASMPVDARAYNRLVAAAQPSVQTYTAVLGNWTLGNGTSIAWYVQMGFVVHFYTEFTFGTTSVFTAGDPGIGLPVPADTTYMNSQSVRTTIFASIEDNSGSGHQPGTAYSLSGGSTVKVLFHDKTGATNAVFGGVISNVAPFTWTNPDKLRVGGWYIAASL